MDLTTAIDWAAHRKHGVLITIRADGRPQSSDIVYVAEGATFLVSITDDRAKTRNLRRDPRAVLHLTDPATWSYVAFDGTVELSPVTVEAGDPTSDRLVAYYEQGTGQVHPDWDEYRQAMVDERRLVARFIPTVAVGQVR
jgi:PPOX class probable F420-dependent enzyme